MRRMKNRNKDGDRMEKRRDKVRRVGGREDGSNE